MKKTIRQELKNLNAIELMNFVSNKYHTAEKRNLSSLNQCFQFMPQQDMKNHPELITIRSYFNDIRKLLQKHLSDFGKVYFPEIRKNANNGYNFSLLRLRVQSTRKAYLNYSQKYAASLITIIHPRMPRAGWNSATPYY